MSQLVALAVSIGLLGGVATILYLKVGLLIWAGFLAWACFFHSGGNNAALQSTVICNIFGAFCAWVAAMLLVSVSMADVAGLPVWPGIVVAITVGALVLGSTFKPFASIPAAVYGYAATFAFLLANPGTNLTKEMLTSAGMGNAFVIVVVSMVLGALFGIASGKMAGALKK